MPIPTFQDIMLPLLHLCADGAEHSNDEAYTKLADHFQLSESERKQMLPSGRQTIFTNRVAWAKAHMRMALLVENVRRGSYKITARGRELLTENPERIDMKVLSRFPDYQANRTKTIPEMETAPPGAMAGEMTPHEKLEEAYQTIRKELATNLLIQVRSSSPDFFEQLVVDLLLKMGYGGTLKDAGDAIGKSGDEGIDGIIKEDRLGLDTIYIQAKRWEKSIGRPDIQQFVGALQGQKARKGVFITTSTFTKEARDYASRIESKVVLIDGDQLSELMIDYGLGVSSVAAYEIKRIDGDYFSGE